MPMWRGPWVAALAAVLALSACGDDAASSAPESATWLAYDVRSCLESSGAEQARTADDLAFYREDRAVFTLVRR